MQHDGGRTARTQERQTGKSKGAHIVVVSGTRHGSPGPHSWLTADFHKNQIKSHLFVEFSCENHDVTLPEAICFDFMGRNWEKSFNFQLYEVFLAANCTWGGVWSCKIPKTLNPPTQRGGMVFHYYEDPRPTHPPRSEIP